MDWGRGWFHLNICYFVDYILFTLILSIQSLLDSVCMDHIPCPGFVTVLDTTNNTLQILLDMGMLSTPIPLIQCKELMFLESRTQLIATELGKQDYELQVINIIIIFHQKLSFFNRLQNSVKSAFSANKTVV